MLTCWCFRPRKLAHVSCCTQVVKTEVDFNHGPRRSKDKPGRRTDRYGSCHAYNLQYGNPLIHFQPRCILCSSDMAGLGGASVDTSLAACQIEKQHWRLEGDGLKTGEGQSGRRGRRGSGRGSARAASCSFPELELERGVGNVLIRIINAVVSSSFFQFHMPHLTLITQSEKKRERSRGKKTCLFGELVT